MADELRGKEIRHIEDLILSTNVSRADLEQAMPTCGRKDCGYLAGHRTVDDAWSFMLARVADEVGRRLIAERASEIEAPDA